LLKKATVFFPSRPIDNFLQGTRRCLLHATFFIHVLARHIFIAPGVFAPLALGGKGREGKGREGKGREGEGREGKGSGVK
jgi:hypothetical protein